MQKKRFVIHPSTFVKKTDYSSKITGIESKIPSITGLVTNSALTAVENKIPNNLVKKTDHNTKISDTESKINNHNHDKYISSLEFNNLAAGVFTARLAQADLVTKTDFDTRLQNISKRITSNKSKYLLVENELKKIQKVDSRYFRGRNCFEEDGVQNYLVFQPMYC